MQALRGNEWRSEADRFLRVVAQASAADLNLLLCCETGGKIVERTCNECDKVRTCTEKLVIHQLPPVLTFKLPSFDSVNNRVRFQERIDFGAVMNAKKYELYAVVVRVPGHYYAHCKAPNGQWNTYNDLVVSKVSLNEVLRCNASTLYYKESK